MSESMVASLVADRSRLIDIEYLLVRTARLKCGEMGRPHSGALVVSEESFEDDTVRTAALGVVGQTESVRIVHLVPGGSFAKGGLEEGDHILAIGGQKIESGQDLSKYMLAEKRDSTNVRFIRGDSRPHVAFVPLQTTCPIRFGIAPRPYLVPWQPQRLFIAVPLALARIESDDALAVAMAHQMAHALFDQPDDDPLASELRADRLGLQLASLSGFDIQVAERFWEEVAIEHPRLIGEADSRWKPLAWTKGRRNTWAPPQHPEIAKRLPQIREILAADRESGAAQ